MNDMSRNVVQGDEARRAHLGQVAQALKSVKQRFHKTLGQERSDRFIQSVIVAVRKNEQLQRCSPASIAEAAAQCSALKLDIANHQGYLVPYWNSKLRCMEAQFQLGFRGMIALARRDADVVVKARPVYVGDLFRYRYGLDEDLRHEPSNTAVRNFDNLDAVYCIIEWPDGRKPLFQVATRSEILENRDRTKSRDRQGNIVGPWATDPIPMALKFITRATLSRSGLGDIDGAVTGDAEAEAGITIDMEAQREIDEAMEVVEGQRAPKTQGESMLEHRPPERLEPEPVNKQPEPVAAAPKPPAEEKPSEPEPPALAREDYEHVKQGILAAATVEEVLSELAKANDWPQDHPAVEKISTLADRRIEEIKSDATS